MHHKDVKCGVNCCWFFFTLFSHFVQWIWRLSGNHCLFQKKGYNEVKWTWYHYKWTIWLLNPDRMRHTSWFMENLKIPKSRESVVDHLEILPIKSCTRLPEWQRSYNNLLGWRLQESCVHFRDVFGYYHTCLQFKHVHENAFSQSFDLQEHLIKPSFFDYHHLFLAAYLNRFEKGCSTKRALGACCTRSQFVLSEQESDC